MANIDDVAKLAGVSKMTVSRVINGADNVKEETVQKVRWAIKELDYRPNMVAKSLATHRTHTIACVVVNISDPFHNLVNQGIETIGYQRGYTTLICDTHTKDREKDYIDMFIGRKIDGVIFHHLDISEGQVKQLEENGVKCLLLDNEQKLTTACRVDTDNYMGARMAAEYLISLGHTRIGCLHGVLEMPSYENIDYEDTFQYSIWRERTRGFMDVMKENNLDATLLYTGNGLNSRAFGLAKAAVQQIFESNERPTALYCQNDIMAVAAVNALFELGKTVPGDLAIVGHDGLELSRMLRPYITTIMQPRFEMGVQAANVLIDRIEGKKEIRTVLLEPSLSVGDTT